MGFNEKDQLRASGKGRIACPTAVAKHCFTAAQDAVFSIRCIKAQTAEIIGNCRPLKLL
jgi:hypothetical protein